MEVEVAEEEAGAVVAAAAVVAETVGSESGKVAWGPAREPAALAWDPTTEATGAADASGARAHRGMREAGGGTFRRRANDRGRRRR